MRRLNRRVFVVGGLLWLTSACAPNPVNKPEPLDVKWFSERDSWLLVDTRADTLSVMQGQKPIKVFPRIALGASGAGFKYRRGDNKTPVGVFRVGWVNEQSKFKTFIGLDYPNLDYAERALRDHRIDQWTYQRVRDAWVNGYTPPQDTPLGGQIGIHGIGLGDPWIHSAGINWTSGCVALDNAQIAALRPWIKKGMRVEIR